MPPTLLLLCVMAALAILLGPATGNESWKYGLNGEGQSLWKTHFRECKGSLQSPINIDTSSVVKASDVDNFSYETRKAHDTVQTLINNGHAATVQVSGGQFDVSGGGLHAPYRLVQYHFHVGSSDTRGSEHTVDGRRFPLEMHMVHINTEYGGLTQALREADGLAVFGFLFEIQSDDSAIFEDIVTGLNDVIQPGGQTTISSGLDVVKLPQLAGRGYYRYQGSLTTPPCSESVVWTVFTDPLGISTRQLEMFRKLHASDGGPIVDNFRSTQPINGRRITVT